MRFLAFCRLLLGLRRCIGEGRHLLARRHTTADSSHNLGPSDDLHELVPFRRRHGLVWTDVVEGRCRQ